jgi:hypothetical protein
MSEAAIREYARVKGFHGQTLERWLSWSEAAGNGLLRIAVGLKAGENHLRDLMDWLEEISLRDGLDIAAILSTKAICDIETDPRLGRADKLKRIKEQIRRLRFPRLAQAEDAIAANIRAMKLAPEIHLSVPPGLEGGRLNVEFSVANQAELKRLAAALAAAAERDCAQAVFDIMAGTRGVSGGGENL